MQAQNEDFPFYMEVWDDRVHRCECCGEPIFDARLFNFHHVLEKREKDNKANEYSQYRHCKWNIMLLCWMCHDAYERNPVIIRLEPIRILKNKLLIIHELITQDLIFYDRDIYWTSDQNTSNLKLYTPCSKLLLL